MNMKKKGGKVAPSAEGGSQEYFEGGKPVNDIEMGDDQVEMLELVEEELDEINEESVEKMPQGVEDEPAELALSPEQIATEPPEEEPVEEHAEFAVD